MSDATTRKVPKPVNRPFGRCNRAHTVCTKHRLPRTGMNPVLDPAEVNLGDTKQAYHEFRKPRDTNLRQAQEYLHLYGNSASSYVDARLVVPTTTCRSTILCGILLGRPRHALKHLPNLSVRPEN